MIFEEDSSEDPIRFRINYYVILFVGLILLLIPVATLSLLVRKDSLDDKLALEDRQYLLSNLRSVTKEKSDLLRAMEESLYSYYEATGGVDKGLLKAVIEKETDSSSITPQTTLDALSSNISDTIRQTHFVNSALGEGAYFAIYPIWNRVGIYSVVPKGRPLQPGSGFITSGFGQRPDPFGHEVGNFHAGIDFAAAPKTPIIATGSGIVLQSVNVDRPGYGRMVRIHHGLGYTSLFAHCSEVLVKTGDRVYAGQVIALLGRSGRATGNHVHYEVQLGKDSAMDPFPFVKLK